MYQTLTVSDALFERLQSTARRGGFENVEELIQSLIVVWDSYAEELARRHATARRIHALQERLTVKYGAMQDSVSLIQQDRER